MIGLIDIHSHILPGLDDGARDMEQTKNMLKIAEEEGIRFIIATPHYHEGVSTNSIETLNESYKKVQQVLSDMNSPIEIHLGTEIYYSHESVHLLKERYIPTMAGSRYVLVEFSPRADYRYIKNGIQDFLWEGYSPILAHTERYENLVLKMDYVEELIEMGAYVQVNAASIAGDNGRMHEKLSKKLLKKGLVHFVSTDSHSERSRSPKLEKCVNYITKKYGTDYVSELLIENPQKVLKNLDI